MQNTQHVRLHAKHTTCTSSTGWPRPIGCLKLQVIFHKGATNYRALLRKTTYKDKASYGSSPPCVTHLLCYCSLCVCVCERERVVCVCLQRSPHMYPEKTHAQHTKHTQCPSLDAQICFTPAENVCVCVCDVHLQCPPYMYLNKAPTRHRKDTQNLSLDAQLCFTPAEDVCVCVWWVCVYKDTSTCTSLRHPQNTHNTQKTHKIYVWTHTFDPFLKVHEFSLSSLPIHIYLYLHLCLYISICNLHRKFKIFSLWRSHVSHANDSQWNSWFFL